MEKKKKKKQIPKTQISPSESKSAEAGKDSKMGLQGQLSDVSSDSIPLMLLALLATLFKHLRSFFLRFSSSSEPDTSASVYSGLTNLSVLADQLKLNRLLSYLYADTTASASSDCIVCLSTLKTGEEVRKLDCRHVFHKQCLEGWIQHLNFNCPLCRSPLIPLVAASH